MTPTQASTVLINRISKQDANYSQNPPADRSEDLQSLALDRMTIEWPRSHLQS